MRNANSVRQHHVPHVIHYTLRAPNNLRFYMSIRLSRLHLYKSCLFFPTTSLQETASALQETVSALRSSLSTVELLQFCVKATPCSGLSFSAEQTHMVSYMIGFRTILQLEYCENYHIVDGVVYSSEEASRNK